MTDRIGPLGARVAVVPELRDVPELVARIVRLWAELHEFDPALARVLAAKLPSTRISRGGPRGEP